MSEVCEFSCDGCGLLARQRYSRICPDPGWATLTRQPGIAQIDVCSVECLDRVAGILSGRLAACAPSKRTRVRTLPKSAVREIGPAAVVKPAAKRTRVAS